MKKIQVVLIMLISVLQLKSQITIQGTVIDAESKEVISFVNIGIITLGQGTVSDMNGKFELNVNSEEEIITFSSIGYKTVNIKARDLKPARTLALESEAYEMGLIEIESKRFNNEEVQLGEKNKERGHSIGFGSAQLGTEIGAIIEVKKTTYVKSANFVLNHAKGDSLLFRINIYDYSTGEIGKNILIQNIIVKEKQKKGVITVNLEDYDIILDSDVLLTLEWLRNFDETGNKDITFDTKKSKKHRGIYFRYSSNGAFTKMNHKPKLKPCFYFIGKQTM